MSQIFKKTAVITDFDMDTTVTLPANKWTELFTKTVPAQQKLYFGNGAIVGGVDDRGTFKIDVEDASGTAIPCAVRLVVKDANKLATAVILEERSENLLTSGSGIKVGYSQPGAREDSYLVVEVKPASALVAAESHAVCYIPITIETL